MNVRHSTQIWKFLGVALASLALLIGAAIPAAADELMRVTFIRHGESAGNASGLIDTKTPGPVLTPTGQLQAQAVADLLGDNNYDSIYASTMIRTYLTATPMSQYLGLPIQVLPGLQEIEAGAFEGTPEANAAQGYALVPLAWALQNNRAVPMPGTSPTLDGNVFDARMDAALQTMYDNGDRNPVVFSHGGAIMFWTMMNAVNLTTAQKLNLLQTAALGNTDYVIVEGNNVDGWTLVNWNGQLFNPEPTLEAEVARQVRTLTRQLTNTWNQVMDSFATGDFTKILTAINRGITDATFSVVKFTRAVGAKVIHDLTEAFTPASTPSSQVSTVAPTDTNENSAPALTSLTDTKDSTATVLSSTNTKKRPNPTVALAPKARDALPAQPSEPAAKLTDDATDPKGGNDAVAGKDATDRVDLGKTPAKKRADVAQKRDNTAKNKVSGKVGSGSAKSTEAGSKQRNAA